MNRHKGLCKNFKIIIVMQVLFLINFGMICKEIQRKKKRMLIFIRITNLEIVLNGFKKHFKLVSKKMIK
jgi:hypothetical protein